MSKKEIELPDRKIIDPYSNYQNPFPGLRSFGIEESHLFFGREGQIDDVLVKLSINRFVTVVGASGSGKSSLIYCGIIPILQGGFMTQVGSSWRVVKAKPGTRPIENLAEALLTTNPEYHSDNLEEKSIKRNIISATLRSSSLGLIEAIEQISDGKRQNFFVLIDQFEELFRFRKNDEFTVVNESIAFVNLLLEAINNEKLPIYIAITLRSDYIGHCAQFPDLTQKINESHYLIPRMSRDEKRLAIEGPVLVGGGKIAPRLVQQLLNDVGDNSDQLPLLQHALMRTWDYWIGNKDEKEPIDIKHYDAVGKISGALSEHANEAFEELSKKEQEVCEILFKTITEKSRDNNGVRRPTPLKVIALIAEVKEEEVIKVIEKFRQPGRSLLMPGSGVKLTPESIIDLSHESLMRIWTKLKIWVEEEAEAVEMYLKLSEAATMYQIGKSSLWRPPDLQLALNWQQKHKPSLEWAERYDPAFERAMVFLDTSRKEFEAEQKNKEMLQRRMLRRAKSVALVLGVTVVISIAFLVFAWVQQRKALENEKEAKKQRSEALRYAQEALKQAEIAQTERRVADEQRRIAILSEIETRKQKEDATEQRFIAEKRTVEAVEAKKTAEEQENLAKTSEIEAKEQKKIAEIKREEAFRLRLLSISKSLAIKSHQINDLDLRGLLAKQAYLFNREYDGDTYDHDIYDGLHYAYKALKGEIPLVLNGHKDAIRSIVFSSTGKYLYTTGADGKVNAWDIKNGSPTSKIISVNMEKDPINRALAISPNDNFLVSGNTGEYIQIIDLKRTSGSPKKISAHKKGVWDFAFLANNSGFYSTGADSTIRYCNMNSSSLSVKCLSRVRSIAISADNRFLVGCNESGQVLQWDRENAMKETVIYEKAGVAIHSVIFNPVGSLLAFGDNKGVVRIMDFKEKKISATLLGHTSSINDITFNKSGKMMASASNDGSVRIWTIDSKVSNNPPIVLKDHNGWVMCLAFSPDSEYIVTGTSKSWIKIWPTNSKSYADRICGKIKRNFSGSEWERYVGADIKISQTCPALGEK